MDEAEVEVGMTTKQTTRNAVTTREYEAFKSSLLKLLRSVSMADLDISEEMNRHYEQISHFENRANTKLPQLEQYKFLSHPNPRLHIPIQQPKLVERHYDALNWSMWHTLLNEEENLSDPAIGRMISETT